MIYGKKLFRDIFLYINVITESMIVKKSVSILPLNGVEKWLYEKNIVFMSCLCTCAADSLNHGIDSTVSPVMWNTDED